MVLLILALIAIAFYFGFQIGRRWDAGEREEAAEEIEQLKQRGGIRLRPITVRR